MGHRGCLGSLNSAALKLSICRHILVHAVLEPCQLACLKGVTRPLAHNDQDTPIHLAKQMRYGMRIRDVKIKGWVEVGRWVYRHYGLM
jgi:hypothetical protein